jgi:hypothetical protein
MTGGFLPDNHDVNAFMVRVRCRDLLSFERGDRGIVGGREQHAGQCAIGSRVAGREEGVEHGCRQAVEVDPEQAPGRQVEDQTHLEGRGR